MSHIKTAVQAVDNPKQGILIQFATAGPLPGVTLFMSFTAAYFLENEAGHVQKIHTPPPPPSRTEFSVIWRARGAKFISDK